MTTDDYYNAAPADRAHMVTEARARTKPPTAHTHRGTPRTWEMDGYHEATREKRTPTHRAPGTPRIPDNIPPWVRMIQAHADLAERSRDA